MRDWVGATWLQGLVTFALLGCSPGAAPEDPYLWLEELRSERALEWVAGENERSTSRLESTAIFETLVRDAEVVLGERAHLPLAEIMGDHAYGFWQDDGNPRGVWRRTPVASYLGGEPKWETLLDLDELAAEEGEPWAWAGVRCLEPENDRCLVGLSRSGIAAAIWREFSVSQRDFVEGGFVLPEAQSNWAWMDEDTLFVATDWGDGKTGDAYSLVAKLWTRGEPMGDARVVVDASADGTSVWPETAYRPEGRFAYVGVSRGWLDTTYHAVAQDGRLTRLPCSSACEPRGYIEGRILFEIRNDWTHGGADYKKGSLVAVDVESLDSELVYAPETDESVRSVHVGRSAVFVEVLQNVESVVRRFERREGAWAHSSIDLPDGGVVQLAPVRGRRNESSNPESNALLISREGIATPPTLYYLDADGEVRQIYRLEPSFEAADIRVEQRWTRSSDGVRVPYFVAAKQSALEDGDAPVMLYGYGGFHIPVLPRYRPIHGKLWLEHGGIYVIANIRGGGEFGARWHEAAIKEGRQNAFDDFYAVAEALVADGVTRPERIGIWGASNGGLLTAVALTQRPDLFGAVLSEVPVLDMLRYTELGGSDWIDEFGDPEHPRERAFLRSISPYHNIRDGNAYPPVLVVSSSMDDVVHAGHARKFVARLHEAGADVLYYEATEGGHGGTGLASGAAYEWALQYAFLHETLFEPASVGAVARGEGPPPSS
ncbi:MAG: prolyl oligopeptidase family serine peptidase [Thermoanaerobaculia bacterium]|nr:prolyl oligopeptidase family serine peptidase [Thermoanaerobaculia bacterium]